MDKTTTTTTFKEAIYPVKYQRGFRKCTYEKLVALMIDAQIYRMPNAKQLALTLKNSEELQASVNLSSISSSQPTRRLRDIGADVSRTLFSDMVN
ncbi:hypothetical protein HUG20_04295 [Salicibibacter cibi]|uniref:Uncharacterized protein n=1 Tax=Salicibibacter cibi TaxID=2743001 RepID=A0A7T6Z981_9BACI|nr:hypothetical protein [Salicibibacter cibi]QQK79192.1 hypothetical protein HUG20_04295 [Salicibibacter cibi]